MDSIAPILFLLLALGLSIGFTVLWIVCLIDAARTERWGWFVCILVFSFLALFYFLAEYESPAKRRRAEQRRRQRSARRVVAEREEIADLRDEVHRLRAERGDSAPRA